MNEEEKIRDELIKRASKLEEAEPPARDFMYFRNLVEKQQAAVRRSQRRQLALFAVVAALLVSAVILCTGRFAFFFIALQAMALAGSITGLAVFIVRGRKLKAGANG